MPGSARGCVATRPAPNTTNGTRDASTKAGSSARRGCGAACHSGGSVLPMSQPRFFMGGCCVSLIAAFTSRNHDPFESVSHPKRVNRSRRCPGDGRSFPTRGHSALGAVAYEDGKVRCSDSGRNASNGMVSREASMSWVEPRPSRVGRRTPRRSEWPCVSDRGPEPASAVPRGPAAERTRLPARNGGIREVRHVQR